MSSLFARSRCFLCSILLLSGLPYVGRAALTPIYQWQVPVVPPYVGTPDPERRAYLWVPPATTQVKGLLVGLENMEEQPMFEDPNIRAACTAANLGIVWISPGYATPDNSHPNMCLTLDPGNSGMLAGAIPAGKTADQECADELANILTQLAAKSGYTEIQYAPMILVGHSAATPFVWSRSVYKSGALIGRIIALLPYKGWYPGSCPRDIPIFHVSSEWEEVDNQWGLTWSNRDMPSLKTLRAQASNCLIGEFVQPGTGHYNYAQEGSGPLATFIKEVAAKRLPATWNGTSLPTLMTISANSGYLIDPAQFGTNAATPVSYSAWTASGKDPLTAYWYIDQAVAQAVCDYMNPLWAKSPQMINVYQDPNHILAPISDTSTNGNADYAPTLQSDNVTFTMSAAYLSSSPTTRLYNGLTLSHSSSSILFKSNGSGGLLQTGANTFVVWIGRNSISRQGLPWEPFVIAYNTGDGTHRGADRPAHIEIPTRNTGGTAQTINFPTIPDQSHTSMSNLTLNATSSSGRGVQYWVVAGPYQINGISNVLIPTTIPAKTKFPMEVVIGAYQWGLKGGVLQSAGPVFSTFQIN